MLGIYLQRFNRKNPREYVWEFRCPICGDSKTDKTKTRGFIYKHQVKNTLLAYCHNCQQLNSFRKFLELVNKDLYQEYLLEIRGEKKKEEEESSDETLFKNFIKAKAKTKTLKTLLDEKKDRGIDLAEDKRCQAPHLYNILDLGEEHPARQYLQDRKIPEDKMKLFYYTDGFKKFANSFRSGTFKEPVRQDTGRIIIPFLNENGKMFILQGRSISANDKVRYFTINVIPNYENERVFGLERIDGTDPLYVVEGPFDSVFLPNCIAVAGSAFRSTSVKDLIIRNNGIVIADNQPRNKQIAKIIKQNIDEGYKICLFPKNLGKYKDINDMVMNGMNVNNILQYVKDNTFRGIPAKLAFSEWKRI